MILITWLKKIFKSKSVHVSEVNKNQELTDIQLDFLKVKYKKLEEHASELSVQQNKDKSDYIEGVNGKCPKCKSTNVNDRIKRLEGKIDGSSSGYGWNALSFGESYSSGSIHGKFDTNEVNKCNDCQNEWKKAERGNYFYPSGIIDTELSIIGYFLRGLKSARNVTWVKTDLKEKYNSLEEKRAAMLKDAIEGTWAHSTKKFWNDYPIELIEKLAAERFDSYDKRHWSESYNRSDMRDILNLRTIDEFIF